MTELKRLIDDNKADANKSLVKKQEQQLNISPGCAESSEKVAMSRGFEMVPDQRDATTQQEYWSPPNIARKTGQRPDADVLDQFFDISVDIVTSNT